MRSPGPAPPWMPEGWLLVIPVSLCSRPDSVLERKVLELGRSKPHHDLSPSPQDRCPRALRPPSLRSKL